MVFIQYVGTVSSSNTPIAVQVFTHGAPIVAFLAVSISVLLKKKDKQFSGYADISLKEKAKMLYDGSHFDVPPNTLVICPFSDKSNKRPLKRNENQDEVRIVFYLVKFFIT